MVLVGRLVAKFNTYYDRRPLLTTMVTNAVCHTGQETTNAH